VIQNKILEENAKIESYFAELIKKKEKFISFNKRLAEALEIYSAMIKVKKRQTLQKHFEKVKIGEFGAL